jgi:uncharacterized protein (TIGR03437 family)
MERTLRKLCLTLALLSATALTAAPQNFLLGVNYSELIPTGSLTTAYPIATATDAQGSIYILTTGETALQSSPATYYLTKLAPTGHQVVYQTQLTFSPSAMAVDTTGNVYLAGSSICTGQCPPLVQKLATDGKTVLYELSIAPDATLNGIAVDSEGRAYITGWTPSGDLPTTPGALQPTATPPANGYQAFVVRLKPQGAIDYATYFGGTSQSYPAAIAVDAAGSAFIIGFTASADFPTTPGAFLAASGIPNPNGTSYLIRLSVDGSSLIYSTFTNTQGLGAAALAVDASDNAVVALNGSSSSELVRFNPQGTAVTFAQTFPASSVTALAIDSDGNTYAALTAAANFPVRNSIAPCAAYATPVLAALDPTGSVLQSTYIPGAYNSIVLGLGSGSTVYVVGYPNPAFAATQQLAGSQGGLLFLTNFAQTPTAPVVQLACVANAASYDSAGISPGELVSLFGQDIGPATGAQSQVESAAFPKQVAGVQVTFNGTPSPLLYVRNDQINAIAPWALVPGATVNVCVVYNGTATNCIARTVLNQHPGVFTSDGLFAAAVNQDGSLNTASNPAQVGSTVAIFATGLGPIDPAQPDGAIVGFPLPSNTLADSVYWLYDTFMIGSIALSTTVSYGGPAPLEVAGVSQVNFVVQNTSQNMAGSSFVAPFILQAGGPVSMGVLIQPGSNAFRVHVAGE